MSPAVLATALAFAMSAAPASPAADPKALLQHLDDLFRGSSSRARMTMRVVTANWTRELSLESWSKGADRFLVRIAAPQKEKGNATLKTAEGIWNFLPKVNRTMKLPASMMASAWMGSHFTNDDLVQRDRLATSYEIVSIRDGEEIVIELKPKEDAAIVWGKVVVTVRAADRMPLSFAFFDEDMRPARTMTFSDAKKLGARLVPTQLRVTPADKPGESTEIRYEQLELDIPIGDSFFSLRSLEK